ncbi:MAG: response regulator transcription factor [Burkholderiaceae bacterium]|nr:response regulator transcription factor [Burkholderiaceae bacterium]
MDAGLNILIAEDHDRLRSILMLHLQQHGYRVSGVPDAHGLHDIIGTERFDVVVLDLNLPDEDGLVIARRLRAATPQIYIIMMTARTSSADRLAGYQSGADVYITKPSSGDELLAAINNWKRRSGVMQKSAARIQFNLQARELIGKERVSLGSSETLILQALCTAPNLRLEYFRLMELLHQEIDSRGKASLEVHITRLRKKLLQAGCSAPAIKAIRNDGYQLVESVLLI